jgi:hypothetical protein
LYLQLFKDNQPPGLHYNGCALYGIELSGDRYLANLGNYPLPALHGEVS